MRRTPTCRRSVSCSPEQAGDRFNDAAQWAAFFYVWTARAARLRFHHLAADVRGISPAATCKGSVSLQRSGRGLWVGGAGRDQHHASGGRGAGPASHFHGDRFGHGEAWRRRFTPGEAALTNAPWALPFEIGRSGQWWLEGVAADHPPVAIHLRTGAIESLQTVPKVHAHGDAHYQAVVSALATAQTSGLRNVIPAPL